MAKSLVTGGAGFIGSNIVDALLKRGDEVRILDNLTSGKIENVKRIEKDVEFIKGDVRDKSAVKKAIRGVDHVFHLAAMRAVQQSVEVPDQVNEANVTGTLNVLLAAKENKVQRVIFTSSSSVYGDNEDYPVKETARPNPLSPYAATKIMGEYYCRIFTKLYGLETVSLRYFNVFGPRQNPQSLYSAVIPIFIDCLLKRKRPEIHWDGKQSRDFSYIDNVVLGNLLASKSPNAVGEVFNIACHDEYSVLDIFNNLKEILKVHDIEPIFKPKRAGDVRRSFADISKAEKMLGFKVQTRFREGLEKTVEWFFDSGIFKRAAKRKMESKKAGKVIAK